MDFEYYKKDIHRSIEQVLYGFFTYQYFLDTSLLGLLFRCLIQVQFLSNKQIPMRIGLYIVLLSSVSTMVRHCFTPSRYGAIIDFIGQVHPPSKKTLLFSDLQIMLLQSVMVIISKYIPADQRNGGSSRSSGNEDIDHDSTSDDEGSGSDSLSTSSSSASTRRGNNRTTRRATRTTATVSTTTAGPRNTLGPNTSAAVAAAHSAGMPRLAPVASTHPLPTSSAPSSGPPPPSYTTFDESFSSATRPASTTTSATTSAAVGAAAMASSPSSILFESSVSDGLDDFYRDDEEEIQNTTANERRHNSEDDGDEDVLADADGYDRVLDEETFVVQIAWDDTWEYLWSDQAGLAGIAGAVAAAAARRSSSSSSDATDPVQNLPV